MRARMRLLTLAPVHPWCEQRVRDEWALRERYEKTLLRGLVLRVDLFDPPEYE